VGKNAKVGADCIIYPNVTLREKVIVGDRVIIHSGTVIGSDGFGYTKVGEEHIKIPQTGTVVIEDDVEIGACVTVDRARFDRTIIGKGTKIDNLVQIAHNVQLGKNCLVIALAGIAGSTVLEDNVIIAGQVGVAGHLRVGAGAIAMAGSGVINDVPAGATLFGYPADDHKKTWRNLAHLGKISQYVERIKALEAKVQQLEKGTGATS
jgi:UDP-3-O-[3-hydroxymyristoyl] glucosamine N-acyltransferase